VAIVPWATTSFDCVAVCSAASRIFCTLAIQRRRVTANAIALAPRFTRRRGRDAQPTLVAS
jgi:hypothetical protein